MGSTMTDRRIQILETAADLLQGKSFSAFSYKDLADQLGLTKASIHYYFATKEDLALELLEFYQGNGARWIEELESRSASPAEFVAAFLDSAEDVLFQGARRICPMDVFEVDAEHLPKSILRRLEEIKEEYRAVLARSLAAGRESRGLCFEGEPAAQAALVMAALQGARNLGWPRDLELFRGVVRQLRRSMGLGD